MTFSSWNAQFKKSSLWDKTGAKPLLQINRDQAKIIYLTKNYQWTNFEKNLPRVITSTFHPALQKKSPNFDQFSSAKMQRDGVNKEFNHDFQIAIFLRKNGACWLKNQVWTKPKYYNAARCVGGAGNIAIMLPAAFIYCSIWYWSMTQFFMRIPKCNFHLPKLRD